MIKVALPAGDLRSNTASLLEKAGLHAHGYAEGSRTYRLASEGGHGLLFRVFREQDIPIQIALGNYDIGICHFSWIEELLGRFPSDAVVKIRGLDFGQASLYVAASPESPTVQGGLSALAAMEDVRIVSEYPNLAELFALSLRLPCYRIFSVWGAAEAYPPEDADVALVSAPDERWVYDLGLVPVHRLLLGSAWIIANRRSLRAKDLSPFLAPILASASGDDVAELALPQPAGRWAASITLGCSSPPDHGTVRLALPDGHQQPHALKILQAAGIELEGYGQGETVRRPRSNIPGLAVKVIRPQDMPQQVALGNFHLAITGRDWLLEHLYQFPSSPVAEAVDLGAGRYRMAAVVSEDVPAGNLAEAVDYWRRQGRSVIRVASEYLSVADHYARRWHLGRYQVIPISGASEGFVPEDAEILIEGSETGKTFIANHLKPIDTLFYSTTCLAVGTGPRSLAQERLVSELVERFRQAVTSGATAVPREV